MKTYTLTVTKEQLDVLAGFVNEMVKATGIGVIRPAAIALDALETAQEVEEPKEIVPDDGA